MRISIFGLGYVGCVSLGCLAQDKHTVVGVDINEDKVNLINQGRPTIVEKYIDKILAEQSKRGKVSATSDFKQAILNTDVSIICVGTPTTESGHLNLKHIFNVAEQIGTSLSNKNDFHTIVIRSTVLPGTNVKFGQIVEESSGKKRNVDFGIVSHPEFMREGSAVDDYYNPGIIVLASDSDRSLEIVKELCKTINAPIEVTDVGVAEMIKYVNNSFHALKIVFANEVGLICKKAGIDSHKLFKVFCYDDKLNISPKYFKPGFAYGGSCLPKDLRALKTIAHDSYIKSPVIDAIDESNENQKRVAFDMIASTGKKNIGIIGLSFKPGTDDLRYSPSVELVEKLLGKGYTVHVYDKDVFKSRLTGTNKAYIDKHLPHLTELITDDLESVINGSDVLVIAHNDRELSRFSDKLSQKAIVDLVRIDGKSTSANYEGICW